MLQLLDSAVYTPQVVINGKSELVGSNRPLLLQTVNKELAETGSSAVSLEQKKVAGQLITLQWSTANVSANHHLQIALLQLHAATPVKKGENRGRYLEHINVVREFKTLVPSGRDTGEIQFVIPPGLTTKDVKVIAFLQDKHSKIITAATELVIRQV